VVSLQRPFSFAFSCLGHPHSERLPGRCFRLSPQGWPLLLRKQQACILYLPDVQLVWRFQDDVSDCDWRGNHILGRVLLFGAVPH
jgi:hypothetical protein